MANFSHVMARAFNQPLMLEPGYASHFLAYLGTRTGVDQIIGVDGAVISDLKEHAESYQSSAARYDAETGRREAYSIVDGVATIPVEGTLIHKSGTIDPSSGAQGYDGIVAKLDKAEADDRVYVAKLDFDTPGGEVAGAFTAAARIAAFSKPIFAVVDELAASAGYLLASQADAVYATPRSRVGSIGTITAHTDISKALSDRGVVMTIIAAGKHKAEGNPYEALPAEVFNRVKAELEESRLDFATVVASAMGMSLADVLGTEALVYRGDKAQSIGLVNHVVSTPNEATDHFLSTYVQGNSAMTTKKTTGAQAATAEAPNAEAHAAEVTAARAEGHAAGMAEGATAGATAERGRISAIIQSEPAQARSKFAMHMALTTELPAEQAIALIAGAAVESAPSAESAALGALKEGANAPADAPASAADAKAANEASSAFKSAFGL